MTEVPCLLLYRLRRGRVCSLLVSSIVSTRGRVQLAIVEYRYSHANILPKELTVDNDN